MFAKLRAMLRRRRDDKRDQHMLTKLAAHYSDKDLEIQVEMEREADGRWIAEVPDLPGVMAYGATMEDALKSTSVLALRVIADRLENEEAPQPMRVSFVPRECVASR